MSFYKRRVYPKNSKVFFDGGLNTLFNPALIADNESPDCMNVVFDNGGVETRGGSEPLASSLGSFTIDSLYTKHNNNGSEQLIAFADSKMWRVSLNSAVSISSTQNIFAAGTRVSAAEAENYMFIGNGLTSPMKYDGTTVTTHGIPAPVSAPSLTSINSGILSGPYAYVYTNVNSALVESDISPLQGISVSGATVRVQFNNAPAIAGVIQRRIYRTEVSGSTPKLLTTIADNTTMSYDDNIADTALGDDAPIDNGQPPTYSIIKYHGGLRRMFMNDISNPSYVWYTEADNPYTVKVTNFFRMGDDTGDLVNAFEVYENVVVVFCVRFNYIIYFPDNTPTSWIVSKTKATYSSRSPFGIVAYQNKLLFPATDAGVFVGFSQYEGENISADVTFLTIANIGSDLVSDKIRPDMEQIQQNYIKNISSIVYKDRVYIAVTYAAGAQLNNRIYVLDFSIGVVSNKQQFSWSRWDNLNISQFAIFEDKLYGASSSTTGIVLQLLHSTPTDSGQPIDSYYWTKEFPGYDNETNNDKDFRYLNFLADTVGDFQMGVRYRTDSEISQGNEQPVTLNPGGSLWGTMIWGVDPWGGGVMSREYKLFLGTARGRRIQFQFNNLNAFSQRFKVHFMTYTYLKKGSR